MLLGDCPSGAICNKNWSLHSYDSSNIQIQHVMHGLSKSKAEPWTKLLQEVALRICAQVFCMVLSASSRRVWCYHPYFHLALWKVTHRASRQHFLKKRILQHMEVCLPSCAEGCPAHNMVSLGIPVVREIFLKPMSCQSVFLWGIVWISAA